MSYITDNDAIRDAQDNLQNAILEKKTKDIEKQKKAIQDVIDALEKYKEKWEEIADLWDDMQNEKLADSILGPGWKDKVLKMDMGLYQGFADQYVALEQLRADNQVPLAEANYEQILQDIANTLGGIASSLEGLFKVDEKPETRDISEEWRPYSNPNTRFNEELNQMQQELNKFYQCREELLKLYSDAPIDTGLNDAIDALSQLSVTFNNGKFELYDNMIEGANNVLGVFDSIDDVVARIYEFTGLNIDLNLDTTNVESTLDELSEDKIESVETEVIVNTEMANSEIDNVIERIASIPDEHNTDITITDSTEDIIGEITNTLDAIPKKIAVDVELNINVPDGEIKIPISEIGKTEASGTLSSGRAFAKGTATAEFEGQALVGELGAEMRIRDGQYELLGKNGAEFTDVKPDDIIFNASQTKQLLKNGHINSRGKAYADGTGFTPLSSSDPQKYALLNSFIPKITNSTDIIKSSVLNIDSSIKELTGQMDKINMRYSASGQTPIITVNNPTFECTGVTGEQVLHQIENSFAGIFTKAYQQSMK